MSSEPRCRLPPFVAAKEAELDGLRRRGVFEAVDRVGIAPCDPYAGVFVFALKGADRKHATHKSRLVVQRSVEKEKGVFNTHVLNSTSILNSSPRHCRVRIP